MSRLDTNAIRHTSGSADNVTLDNSQNVTVEGNLTVDGTTTLTGTVTLPNDAVGLAQMASGTDGVIITYDASGNPVHVGPGTDGQVLTSTGAGSPPAFENASGGGIGEIVTGDNTFAGTDSGNSDNHSSATNNTGFGHDSLKALTQGDQNTGIGDSALAGLTTQSNNTGVGWRAGYANAGGENTYVGVKAGEDTTGECNVFIGSNAGAQYTTAAGAVGVGFKAFGGVSGSACTAAESVFIGYQAGEVITDGANNTVVGYEAGHKLTTSGGNTIMGNRAGHEAAASFEKNILIGYHCASDITDGTGNVFVGAHIQEGSGDNNCHNYNTGVGYGCLYDIAHGEGNTAIGQSAGADITTGDNNTCIGKDSGLGNSPHTITTDSNRVVIGNNSVTNSYVKVDWTTGSDERDKTDIQDISIGLDFVKQLKPKSFWFREDRTSDPIVKLGSKKYGFLAQDILALEGSDNVVIDDDDANSLKYQGSHLIPILVNAIKELSTEVNTLKTKVAALEAG